MMKHAAQPPRSKGISGKRRRQLEHLEKRLLEERRDAVKQLGRAGESALDTMQAAGGDLTSFAFHMADQATDATEHEKAFLLASREGRFLWHIDEALRRLYRTPETFGLCQECGAAIAFERLDVVPHARFCFTCKQHEEAGK